MELITMGDDGGDGGELRDLYRLLSSSYRPAAVPVGELAKLGAQVENHNKAMQLRREQQAREQRAQQHEEAELAAVRRARSGASQRILARQSGRGAVSDLVRRNRAKAEAVRSENEAGAVLRQQREDEYMAKAEVNVDKMRGHDARCDAAEEAADALERQEASRGRIERSRNLESARTNSAGAHREELKPAGTRHASSYRAH